MLAITIIATIILGIKILFGWFCKVLLKAGKNTDSWENAEESTKGFILAKASWGIIDIYMIVTIWMLYANIGG